MTRPRVVTHPQRCPDDSIMGTVLRLDRGLAVVRWDRRKNPDPGSKAGTTTLEIAARLAWPEDVADFPIESEATR